MYRVLERAYEGTGVVGKIEHFVIYKNKCRQSTIPQRKKKEKERRKERKGEERKGRERKEKKTINNKCIREEERSREEI